MKLSVKILTLLAISILLASCGSSSPSSSTSYKGGTVASDTDIASSISEMTLGDLYYIDFDGSGSATLDFSGASSDAQYLFIVQSTNTSSSSVSIAAQNLSLDPPEMLDNLMRTEEKRLSLGDESPAIKSAKNFSVSKAVGESKSFRVLSSISNASSYTTVDATLMCEADHILLYIDDTVSEDILSEADIESLCGEFDYAAGLVEQGFGSASDINEDGHLAVLVTPAINRLGASGGGIITGYFYAADLYARTSSNPTSNEMEIVYILAPDPTGANGTAISKSFAMNNLMPAVVPHEYQHAVNYNNHVLVNGGSSEASWLNESLSHFAEDYSGFGNENPSRMEIFLADPESTPLTPTSSPDLGERGAGYSFIRFMYERTGSSDTFIRSLVNTTLRGTANVMAAVGDTDSDFDEWTEFMRRWAIALALTDEGISTTGQYQYNARIFNDTTGRWSGVCLVCDTEDNRETILSGPYTIPLNTGNVSLSLSGTSTAFYSIANPMQSIEITGSTSAGLQGVLIRTQ